MVDAYCAHLGAHLGVGGKVEGECIRCPFHGWRYEGESGKCNEIPYGDTVHIPSQAKVRSYPTIERNQMIWAWHSGVDAPPFYDVPEVAEFYDADWLPYEIIEFDVATCCQEMAENNVDFAHFMYVHGTPNIPDDEFEIKGTYKKTVGANGMFVREGYGLGLGVLHMGDRMVFISSTTPIDDENVKVRWIFSAPRSMGDDAAKNAAEGLSTGVSQDLPIWRTSATSTGRSSPSRRRSSWSSASGRSSSIRTTNPSSASTVRLGSAHVHDAVRHAGARGRRHHARALRRGD